MTKPSKFAVINIRSGMVVGKYSSKKRAQTALDKRDNEYGAYVHRIKEIDND